MNATMMYTPPPSEDIDMEPHTDRSDTSSYACEADNPSFRPYILQADEVKGEEFDITRAKYSTSLDPRGYIPGEILYHSLFSLYSSFFITSL